MGSVAQAVLEFDEAVRVPWRPPLAAGGERAAGPVALRVATAPPRRPHAVRAARSAGPQPAPVVQPSAGSAPRRGSTALGHTCLHCSHAPTGDGTAVRLTRRARRLLAVLGAAVGILAGGWIGSSVAGDDDGLVLVSDSSIVVQEGDTLWSIARAVAGDEDVRAVVDAIQEVNGLRDATLVPGQVLRLP
jgi:nucleoid-associated protein YgaU